MALLSRKYICQHDVIPFQIYRNRNRQMKNTKQIYIVGTNILNDDIMSGVHCHDKYHENIFGWLLLCIFYSWIYIVGPTGLLVIVESSVYHFIPWIFFFFNFYRNINCFVKGFILLNSLMQQPGSSFDSSL